MTVVEMDFEHYIDWSDTYYPQIFARITEDTHDSVEIDDDVTFYKFVPDSTLDTAQYFLMESNFWFDSCLLTPESVDIGTYTYSYTTGDSPTT